ncbi:MAG: acyl-CoA dehydrogenase family protein [Actinomycetota bacterium]|nr:acyl-CoA dehydrogenase family protein [Actinomycetota bacterium]
MSTPRELFTADHEAFRESVHTFVQREVAPYHEQWEQDGVVSREVWKAAGRQGLLGYFADEEYGGGGIDDYRYGVVIAEELARGGFSGVAIPLHNDIIGPYLQRLATDAQRRRWLPGFCSGDLITAIAMTEPGAGSDLQGIRTTAVDKGDHYVLNGQKTFISNGILADLVVVVARTDPEAGARGISLLVVERGMDGFERGRNLAKVGQHAQDTAELYFDNVQVPKTNVLGQVGAGFVHLMENLNQERLGIAVAAAAACERILELSLQYSRERQAFGRPIGRFQHNRFTLAEMATETKIARIFVDRCVRAHLDGTLDASEAAMAKWWVTELQKRLVDQAVQLHGGYGYMLEYPIAKAFVDSRVQAIYGGTNEIMKEIIGRALIG